MSQTYISALVIILVTILPKLGVQIGSEELTSLIQAVLVLASGAYIMYRRYQTGDIKITGGRKA